MAEFIVSIVDRYDDGVYLNVPCSSATAEMLQREAETAGLKTIVRRADTAEQALRWLREMRGDR